MNTHLARFYLKDYIKISDPLLTRFLKDNIKRASQIGRQPEKLASYFKKIAAKGKRIRGALLVLGYQLAGRKPKRRIYQASLLMELFHAGLLIHDDIMDQAETRRGLTSLHNYFTNQVNNSMFKTDPDLYGQSMAICAGNGAFYLAWENLINADFPSPRLLKASRVFTDYALRVMNGQVLDLSLNLKEKPTQKDVLKMMYLKSGEYTSEMPLAIGIELAGGLKPAQYRAVMKYANCLGWLFQIQDDILGVYGKTEATGKPNTVDLNQDKLTLLLLHFKSHADPKQKKFQQSLLKKKQISNQDLQKMRSLFKEVGSYAYVMDLAEKYLKLGKRAIPEITQEKQLQNLLGSLLNYMLKRSQ